MKSLAPTTRTCRRSSRARPYAKERKAAQHERVGPHLSKSGSAPGWIRTSDLRIRSPLLYPAELQGLGATAYWRDHPEDAGSATCGARATRSTEPEQGRVGSAVDELDLERAAGARPRLVRLPGVLV